MNKSEFIASLYSASETIYNYIKRHNEVFVAPIGICSVSRNNLSLGQLSVVYQQDNVGYDSFSFNGAKIGMVLNIDVDSQTGLGGKVTATMGTYLVFDDFGNFELWRCQDSSEYVFTHVGRFYFARLAIANF